MEEDGKVVKADVGTPQGAVISPLLAPALERHELDLIYQPKANLAGGASATRSGQNKQAA